MSVRLTCSGIVLELRSRQPALLESLRARLPSAWRVEAERPSERTYLLDGDVGSVEVLDDSVIRKLVLPAPFSVEALLELVESDLHFLLASRAREHIFVHAGVVSFEGRAIVIPGDSMSGKSSLTRALVAAGAVYYSDEYAMLDAQGRVCPYEKEISLRREAARERVPIASLEKTADAGSPPLELGLIVSTHFMAGTEWKPVEVPGGAKVLLLFSHALAARTRPQAVLRQVGMACERAVALRGPRGEAAAVANRILERLAA